MTVFLFTDPESAVKQQITLDSSEAWQTVADVVGDYGDGVVRESLYLGNGFVGLDQALLDRGLTAELLLLVQLQGTPYEAVLIRFAGVTSYSVDDARREDGVRWRVSDGKVDANVLDWEIAAESAEAWLLNGGFHGVGPFLTRQHYHLEDPRSGS